MNDEPLSILIADESERCREALRDTLEPEGYDIVGARSGREAINVVRQVRIHVVVMDVRLPDYSGLEIYHAIKSILGASLPCIFTAMEMSADSIQDALSEDAVTILPKPVDMPRLVHAVDWSVERHYSGRRRRPGFDPERFRQQ